MTLKREGAFSRTTTQRSRGAQARIPMSGYQRPWRNLAYKGGLVSSCDVENKLGFS
jgi:hypothetical protein